VPAPPKDVLHPAFEVSNRIVRSSSFFGDYLLTPVAPLDIERSCEAAEQLVFRDRPVVFLVRDHAEMSHFLAVQLTPLIAVSPLLLLLCWHTMLHTERHMVTMLQMQM